jgi:hypothetical protein
MPVPQQVLNDADKADNLPWIKALAEVRRRASREGYRYAHVQAIIVAIDQYAEKALGNREYFFEQAVQHWGEERLHTVTPSASTKRSMDDRKTRIDAPEQLK